MLLAQLMVLSVAIAGLTGLSLLTTSAPAGAVGNTWTPTEFPAPSNLVAARVMLQSISCPSAGNCSAVGTYWDPNVSTQGILLTETSGTWGVGVKATLPAGADLRQGVALTSVSCASAGNCTAVGSYLDGSGDGQGLLITETAGTWGTGVEATLPSGTYSDPEVAIRGRANRRPAE